MKFSVMSLVCLFSFQVFAVDTVSAQKLKNLKTAAALMQSTLRTDAQNLDCYELGKVELLGIQAAASVSQRRNSSVITYRQELIKKSMSLSGYCGMPGSNITEGDETAVKAALGDVTQIAQKLINRL